MTDSASIRTPQSGDARVGPAGDDAEWVSCAGVELRCAGLDESPGCRKHLGEVIDSVADTVRILHRLTPVGVAMAGANEFDPYKD